MVLTLALGVPEVKGQWCVILTQLHTTYCVLCSILPFLFYCPFICLHCESLIHHQPPICFFVSSFFFFSVDHFHTNVSNISELTHSLARKRDTLVTILQRLFFFFSFKKEKEKVNIWKK